MTNQLCEKCTFKDGKRDGLREDYYDNGRLKVKFTYKDGELDGPYGDYYGDGQLHKKCT